MDIFRVCRSYKEIVNYIKKGGDVNIRNIDIDNATLLHWLDDENSVISLIRAGADVNSRDWDGDTPLYWLKSESSMKALIDAGADVNIQNISGNTVLHGDRINSEGKIRILIKAGINLKALNKKGETPLDYCDVRKVYLKICTEKLAEFCKRNFKYFVFKHWIKSKEGAEWLFHPRRGGKYIEAYLLGKLKNIK